ncbi:MAG: hypothetical protein ACREJD_02630 [Phycisphaerales bacterium]
MVLQNVVVATAILVALAAVTIPALSQVRMDTARQACIGNYRFIAEVSGSYTNDYAGYMWALSWKRGTKDPLTPWPNYFATDLEAQGTQTVSILRRLAHLNQDQAPVPFGWVSPISYSHVVLFDYVNISIPASFLVCPADQIRQRYVEGDFSQMPPTGGDNTTANWRIPFTSSYTASTYQWGPSRQTTAINTNGQPAKTAIWYPLSTDISSWTYGGDNSVQNVNGPKQSSAVRFPSNKVFMSDDYARHNGKPRYYAYQTAGQDLLFHDGSVRYYRTDSTNPGWDPSSSSARGNMKSRFFHTKKADFWGGLDNNATSATFQSGWYRWTRGGLYGWDVPRLSSMVGKLPSATVIENEVDTSSTTGSW